MSKRAKEKFLESIVASKNQAAGGTIPSYSSCYDLSKVEINPPHARPVLKIDSVVSVEMGLTDAVFSFDAINPRTTTSFNGKPVTIIDWSGDSDNESWIILFYDDNYYKLVYIFDSRGGRVPISLNQVQRKTKTVEFYE
jgi:hypothetical protein